MGRLCGGVHEISGIKAPLFLHGWVVGGFLGWVGRGGGVWLGDVVVLWGMGGWVMWWRVGWVVVCWGWVGMGW